MSIELTILSHQAEILQSEAYITSMSCGRGAGKTSTLAILALMEMMAGKKVLIIYPTNNDFRRVLEPAMNQMTYKFNIYPKFNKSTYTWKYGIGEIITVSGEASERLRGPSEISTLLIDECSFMDEMVYTLALATMRGVTVVNPKVYLFSTASTKQNWFARKSLAEGTNLIYASTFDNPFNGPNYAPNLLKQYEGLPEDFIQREIYGKFTDFSVNTIFNNIVPSTRAIKGLKVAGVDLALGGDYTSFVMFDGNILAAMEKAITPKPEDAQRFIKAMCAKHRPSVVNYDCTGHGSYAEVNKWTYGVETNPVNFGLTIGSKYADMRTKIYFDLFQRLKDFYIGVEQSKFNELVEDLRATTIDDVEKAKVKIIKKDEIKKLIGRSPDYGDAAALASIPVIDLDFNNMRLQQVRNNPFGSHR